MTPLIISFLILTSYIAFYLCYVGLTTSHSNSHNLLKQKNKKLWFLFPVTLAVSSFLLMLTAFEYTPEKYQFTFFLTACPIVFTAFAANYKDGGVTTQVHMTTAKLGGLFSFVWAVLMAYSYSWWLIAPVIVLGAIFYLLNRKYHKPVLFLEYWAFSYPYVILFLVIKLKLITN